jgi:hypothetical protein
MTDTYKYKYVPSKTAPGGFTIKRTSVPVASNIPFATYPITWVSLPTGTWNIADDYTAPIIEAKSNKDGCTCKKCKELYPFAEPNQDDGTLICYKCRVGW